MPQIKDRKLLLVHEILPDLTPRQAKRVLMHGTSWPLASEATVRDQLEALRPADIERILKGTTEGDGSA